MFQAHAHSNTCPDSDSAPVPCVAITSCCCAAVPPPLSALAPPGSSPAFSGREPRVRSCSSLIATEASRQQVLEEAGAGLYQIPKYVVIVYIWA